MATKHKQKHSPDDIPTNAETESETESEKRFIRDRIITGDAAEPLSDGELPPGATHRIIEESENEEGLPEIERERFSIW